MDGSNLSSIFKRIQFYYFTYNFDSIQLIMTLEEYSVEYSVKIILSFKNNFENDIKNKIEKI